MILFTLSRQTVSRNILRATAIAALMPTIAITYSLINTSFWNPLFIVAGLGCFAFVIWGFVLAGKKNNKVPNQVVYLSVSCNNIFLNMRYTLSLLLVFSLFASFKQGVGTAKLSCISQSGRTLFEAQFEEYTTIEQAKLTIDMDSMLFNYTDKCYVTFDPSVNVYTLNIESEANGNFDTVRYVQLWAVPSSFHKISSQGTQFGDVYKFSAKLKARDPRKGREFETPTILLSCTLTYTNP